MRVIDERLAEYWNHVGTRRQHVVELAEGFDEMVEMLTERAAWSASASSKREELQITAKYLKDMVMRDWQEMQEEFYRKEINGIARDKTGNIIANA